MRRNELQLWCQGLTPLWHLLMCWASPPHWHGEVYAFRVLKCLPKTEHETWGKEGHGGEDNRPPSEVKFFSCVFGCAQGQLRGRERAEWKQEGGWEGCGERGSEREYERERRKNGEWMNCLGSRKGIPWNSKIFCFFRANPRLSFAL